MRLEDMAMGPRNFNQMFRVAAALPLVAGLLAVLPARAHADICVESFAGCVNCSYSDTVFVPNPTTGIPEPVAISGIGTICVDIPQASPFPPFGRVTFPVFVPGAGPQFPLCSPFGTLPSV